MKRTNFDVIIIGGSYAGSAAALALGRAMRRVMVLDNNDPCNRNTPHSHNFLTHDGRAPSEITSAGLEDILKYPTIQLNKQQVVNVTKNKMGFEVITEDGTSYSCKKLLLASGIRDIHPSIEGFSDCWGISVIHCPYCHGYEVRGEKTAILANSVAAVHMASLIAHWTSELIILTNGKPEFDISDISNENNAAISIIEKRVVKIEHTNGYLNKVFFEDSSHLGISTMYAKLSFEQKTPFAALLGCTINEMGYVEVDDFKRTSVKDLYAAGDNSNMARSVAAAVAAGTM
ncbi:MAG: NAD(P)/FAD-dependent oxidoreductase, partial [Pedobacter sp.]